MGQAKTRGTHAERVAQALVRTAAERVERERRDAEAAALAADREAEKKSAMPPERRKMYERDVRNKRAMLAFALGAVVAMTERKA